MSKTYREWLEEFRPCIIQGYESHRTDKILSGHACEVEEPRSSILKFEKPLSGIKGLKEGEPIPFKAVSLSSRKVTTISVGFAVDINEWAVDPDSWYGIESSMKRIGQFVARKEYSAIVQNLCDYARTSIDSEKKGKLML